MTYILHAIPDWASLIIRLALEEAEIPYTLAPQNYAAGSLNAHAFRVINPNGLIPAMETPDGPMFETGAILLYLIDRHGTLGPGPTDPARPAFLSWLFFTANTLHPTLMQLIHPQDTDPDAPGLARQAHSRLTAKLRLFDDMLARKAPAWMDVAHPSALTGYLAVLIRWGMMLPPAGLRPDLADFPELHHRIRLLESRPHAQRLAAEEKLGPTPFTQPQV